MAIAPLPLPTPAGVAAAACDQLAGMDGTIWAARRPEELLAGIEELQLLKARTAALEAELLAEIDAQSIPKKTLAWGSTDDWYTHLTGTTRRNGKRTVVHARRLTSERPATHDALRDGLVSPDQADVILRAVEDLPLTGTLRADAETHLIDEASRLNASDLARAARHLIEVVDPDQTDRKTEAALAREERAAHLRRRLSITDDGAGGVHIRGRGTVEDAAALRAALLPFTTPTPKPAAPTRRAVRTRTPATTAPACGTPWSGSPSTPSTPRSCPPPTAPAPPSWSTSTPTTSTTAPAAAPATTAPKSPALRCPGWRATPT